MLKNNNAKYTLLKNAGWFVKFNLLCAGLFQITQHFLECRPYLVSVHLLIPINTTTFAKEKHNGFG